MTGVQLWSYLSFLSQGESIFYVDAQIANRIFDLRMAEQDLDESQVAPPFEVRWLQPIHRRALHIAECSDAVWDRPYLEIHGGRVNRRAFA